MISEAPVTRPAGATYQRLPKLYEYGRNRVARRRESAGADAVTELHDEENLLVQMQDRWENYGSLDGIADTHDPFDLAGAPRFELYEKLNSLLNHALTADENLLLRQTLGMGCKQKSIKDLAQQMGTTQKAVQKQLVNIVEKLRHHDDSIQLWKYLNR